MFFNVFELFSTLAMLAMSCDYSNFSNLDFHFLLIGDSCQYWMDLENQKLSSPYYPQYFFADGYNCEWLITAPEGHRISLEFENFNVSKNRIEK